MCLLRMAVVVGEEEVLRRLLQRQPQFELDILFQQRKHWTVDRRRHRTKMNVTGMACGVLAASDSDHTCRLLENKDGEAVAGSSSY